MTVKQLAEAMNLKLKAGNGGLENEVLGGYICDFLSFVIGKVTEGDAWITVIGNINTIAVASLTDLSCIILAENTQLDDDAKKRADENDIPVLASEDSAFSLALSLGRLLKEI